MKRMMINKIHGVLLLAFTIFGSSALAQCDSEELMSVKLEVSISMEEEVVNLKFTNMGEDAHDFQWTDALPYTDIIDPVQLDFCAVAEGVRVRLKRVENLPLYDTELNSEALAPNKSITKKLKLSEFQMDDIIQDADYFYCEYVVHVSDNCELTFISNSIPND